MTNLQIKEEERGGAGRPLDASGRPSLFGTGMSAWEIGAIFVISVAIFLLWGGPLWLAPASSSHVGRIAVSYLVVIPIVALVLWRGRRFRWTYLLSATAVVWGAKLLVTASLYSYLSSGSAAHYEPARPWEEATETVSRAEGYRVAAAPPAGSVVQGTVREATRPAAGAIVFVEAPPPGLPLDTVADPRARLSIERSLYDQQVLWARTGDLITAVNQDAILHTMRTIDAGRTVRNIPVPSGRQGALVAPENAGIYHVGCENHVTESATLVVVDHPYVAQSDARGRFVMRGVPVGDLKFVVVRHQRTPFERVIAVSANHVDTTLEIPEGF